MSQVSKNVLITGASSPSGRAAITRFTQQGHNVFAVSRRFPVQELYPHDAVSFFELDFLADPQTFRQRLITLQLPQIDIVIHCCAATPSTVGCDTEYFLVNVVNSTQLFETVALATDAMILNFSSASVYSKGTTIINENSEIDFSDHYGSSKFFFEQYLNRRTAELNEKQSQQIIALNARIPVLLVKGRTPNFVGKWQAALEEGKLPKLINPKSQFNSCVDIRDIFSLLDYLRMKKILGATTSNVGVTGCVTIEEFFGLVCSQLGFTANFSEEASVATAFRYDCDVAAGLGFEFSHIKDAVKVL